MLDEVTMPRLVVAGSTTGCGKTTIVLGLVAALTERGQAVQTFKVGPDFIDCAYLSHVSHRPCRNLDPWMLGGDGVLSSFVQGLRGADCVIVEGDQAIFDGHGAGNTRSTHPFPGSTAEVASLLAAPVVLVIDVAATGETSAAAALGIKHLDPQLNIIGVILNNCPSEYRRKVVEDAVWNLATLPVLGCIPRLAEVGIPELRTGLLPLAQNAHADDVIANLCSAVSKYCDLDLIERLMRQAGPVRAASRHVAASSEPAVRIGVAYDDAFCFYYTENLEFLEHAGAEIVPFSPLEDRTLPRELDGIYLGGGVSEMFIPRLAGNQSFLESLRRAHAQATPIYAECGGLLLGARSVATSDGSRHEMAGLVPIDVVLDSGELRSGYRELRLSSSGALGSAGTVLRGHEFHFARTLSGCESVSPAYSMHDATGEPLGCEGWQTGNLLASFVHLHFGQDVALAHRLTSFVRAGSPRRRAAAV